MGKPSWCWGMFHISFGFKREREQSKQHGATAGCQAGLWGALGTAQGCEGTQGLPTTVFKQGRQHQCHERLCWEQGWGGEGSLQSSVPSIELPLLHPCPSHWRLCSSSGWSQRAAPAPSTAVLSWGYGVINPHSTANPDPKLLWKEKAPSSLV